MEPRGIEPLMYFESALIRKAFRDFVETFVETFYGNICLFWTNMSLFFLEKFALQKPEIHCNTIKNEYFQGFSSKMLIGGAEPRLNSVDNLKDFLTKLPKNDIKIPNPTFRIFIIGRKVLNHCGNFGSGGINPP